MPPDARRAVEWRDTAACAVNAPPFPTSLPLTPHPHRPPPPQLGAAWRTVLGVRALADPKGFVEKQFKDYQGSSAGKGLALRCGLLNLQVAALQVAACNANMKVRALPSPHTCALCRGGPVARAGRGWELCPTVPPAHMGQLSPPPFLGATTPPPRSTRPG